MLQFFLDGFLLPRGERTSHVHDSPHQNGREGISRTILRQGGFLLPRSPQRAPGASPCAEIGRGTSEAPPASLVVIQAISRTRPVKDVSCTTTRCPTSVMQHSFGTWPRSSPRIASPQSRCWPTSRR